MQSYLLDDIITKLKTITDIGLVERFNNQFEEANKINNDGTPSGTDRAIKYPCALVEIIEADYEDLTRGEQLIKDQIFCIHIGYKNLNRADNGDLTLKQNIFDKIHGTNSTYWNRASRTREEWDSQYTNIRLMKMYFKCSSRDKVALRPSNMQTVDPVVPVIINEPQFSSPVTEVRTDVPLD